MVDENLRQVVIEKKFKEFFADALEMLKVRNVNIVEYSVEKKIEYEKKFISITNDARIRTFEYFNSSFYSLIWPNEADMIQHIIFENADLSWKQSVEFKPVLSAKNKLSKEGKFVRADGYDTLILMVASYKKELIKMAENFKDKVVPISIISTQPHSHYQKQQTYAAFKDVPVKINVVANGIKRKEQANLSIILDALARTIYAGKERVKSLLD